MINRPLQASTERERVETDRVMQNATQNALGGDEEEVLPVVNLFATKLWMTDSLHPLSSH